MVAHRLHRPSRINEISGEILDGGMKVHSALGPGLLETAYLDCLAYELTTRGLEVKTQVPVPLVYGQVRIRVAYRIDNLVERAVIVELKVVRKLHPMHEAQLLSYLKLTNTRLGLLINFNVVHLRNGIKRLVNNL
jgi:GxxExxY protein